MNNMLYDELFKQMLEDQHKIKEHLKKYSTLNEIKDIHFIKPLKDIK